MVVGFTRSLAQALSINVRDWGAGPALALPIKVRGWEAGPANCSVADLV